MWVHNARERMVPDGMGGYNNVIKVVKTDFQVPWNRLVYLPQQPRLSF